MKFKYLDNVKVKSGFYMGFEGIIQDYVEKFISEGGGYLKSCYIVELDIIKSSAYFSKTVEIAECDLEKL